MNQFGAGDAAERVGDCAAIVSAVPSAHAPFVQLELLRLVVLDFQVVSDLPEIGQLHPTRLDAAASRYAVTFACSLHRRFDSLIV